MRMALHARATKYRRPIFRVLLGVTGRIGESAVLKAFPQRQSTNGEDAAVILVLFPTCTSYLAPRARASISCPSLYRVAVIFSRRSSFSQTFPIARRCSASTEINFPNYPSFRSIDTLYTLFSSLRTGANRTNWNSKSLLSAPGLFLGKVRTTRFDSCSKYFKHRRFPRPTSPYSSRTNNETD